MDTDVLIVWADDIVSAVVSIMGCSSRVVTVFGLKFTKDKILLFSSLHDKFTLDGEFRKNSCDNSFELRPKRPVEASGRLVIFIGQPFC